MEFAGEEARENFSHTVERNGPSWVLGCDLRTDIDCGTFGMNATRTKKVEHLDPTGA